MRVVLLTGIFCGILSCFGTVSKAEKPDAHDCFMGDCFSQYIVSLKQEGSGLVVAQIKTTFYCTPGFSCDHRTGQIQNSTYKAMCKAPGGFIEGRDGRRLPEPERDPPHATQAGKELWTSICAKTRVSAVQEQGIAQPGPSPVANSQGPEKSGEVPMPKDYSHPSPTGEGLNVTVIPSRESSGLVIKGEIRNDSDRTQEIPRLRVALQDAQNSEVAMRVIDPPAERLGAGQRAPFETTFEPDAKAIGVVVTFVSTLSSLDPVLPEDTLSVTVTSERGPTGIVISGRIHNGSRSSVEVPKLQIVISDVHQKEIATQLLEPPVQQLEAGANAAFESTFTGNEAAANVSVSFLRSTPEASAKTPDDERQVRAFLGSLYSHYGGQFDGREPGFNPTRGAMRTIFEPDMIKLIEENRRASHGDMALVDERDPFCQCQDSAGMTVTVGRIEMVDRMTAKAMVDLHFPGNPPSSNHLQIILVAANGQWRVYDLGGGNSPSLRAELVRSNRPIPPAKAAKAASPQRTDGKAMRPHPAAPSARDCFMFNGQQFCN